MQLIKSDEINAIISDLRKKDILNFQSNYFLNELDDEVQCIKNDCAIVFLQPEYDFFRLYFAYIKIDDFILLLSKIPSDIPYSIEILQKASLDENLKNLINKYCPYSTTFVRLRSTLENIKVFTKYKPEDIEYATHDDVDLIYNTMHVTFSKFYSHIQTKKVLHDYVDKKWIITPRDEEGNVASFLIYTVSGTQSHNNQGININKNPIYGVKMIDYYNARLHELGVKSVYVWVDTINNKSVQRMHEFYGYKVDGLNNYIFIKD